MDPLTGPLLVVDACALVHLKQAHHPSLDGLDLILRLCVQGLRLRSTAAVHQENVAQTLREWLGACEAAGQYALEQVAVRERREVANAFRGRGKEPGNNDKSLIALAKRLQVPLLTHDEPAALLAAQCRVVVVDAIDLAAFAARHEVLTPEEAERLIAPLGQHAWRPRSWAGSIEETVETRPKWDRLAERLEAWWAPAAGG